MQELINNCNSRRKCDNCERRKGSCRCVSKQVCARCKKRQENGCVAYRQNVMQEVGLLAFFPQSLILINFSDCCARRLLSLRPDFMAQKCEIEERIKAHHHRVLFYPKFHCELNYMEYYWCHSKRYAREHCDYTITGLRENVPCLKKMRLYQQDMDLVSGKS
jgi:hypothetical protein